MSGSSVISDDILAGLRAEAQASGGAVSFVRLEEEGDWCSGVVKERITEEAPFGEVETLVLTNVRTHEGDRDPDAEVTFRLSRSVLRRELGAEAEDGGATPGMLIFVECNGQRTSKNGKAYFAYAIKKADAKAAAKAAKDNKGAPPPKPKRSAAEVLKNDFGGEEAPF